jgi:hypothetical protein
MTARILLSRGATDTRGVSGSERTTETEGVGLSGCAADTVTIRCSDGAAQTDGGVGAVGWIVRGESGGTTGFAAGDRAGEAKVVW